MSTTDKSILLVTNAGLHCGKGRRVAWTSPLGESGLKFTGERRYCGLGWDVLEASLRPFGFLALDCVEARAWPLVVAAVQVLWFADGHSSVAHSGIHRPTSPAVVCRPMRREMAIHPSAAWFVSLLHCWVDERVSSGDWGGTRYVVCTDSNSRRLDGVFWWATCECTIDR